MKTLAVLFLFSLGIIYWGFVAIKEVIEEINYRLKQSSSIIEKSSPKKIVYCVIGVVLGIVGAVFYYKMCVAGVEHFLDIRDPVEEPVPYGIGFIVCSLIFSGGLFGVARILDGENETLSSKIAIITAIVSLAVYITLRMLMIIF